MSPLALVVLLAVAGAPEEEGLSADVVTQAKKLFEAAGRAYQAGNYPVAIAAFEEAYRLSPRPQIEFSMAQAYRLEFLERGDPSKLARAVELYRAYLEHTPEGGRKQHAEAHLATLDPILRGIDEARRSEGAGKSAGGNSTQLMIGCSAEGAVASIDGGAPIDLPAILDAPAGTHTIEVNAPGYRPERREALAVEGRLVALDFDLEPRPAELRISAPDGAEISIDGRNEGTAPLLRPLEIPSGRHFVTVAQSGRYPYATEIDVARGEEASVVANLEPTLQRTVSYVFIGTSAALVAAAAWSANRAFDRQEDARRIHDRLAAGQSLEPSEVDEYNDLLGERRMMVVATSSLIGGAVVVGAVGLLTYILDTPRAPAHTVSARTVSIAPLGGQGAAASVSGRF